MPDGVVDQQRTLLGVSGAGAYGAGEALDRDIHRSQPRDSDRTSAPRLHLNHAALDPELGQELFLVEQRLQLPPLLPQDHQFAASVVTQRDSHQLPVSHDAVDHHAPFFFAVLSCLRMPLLEVF